MKNLAKRFENKNDQIKAQFQHIEYQVTDIVCRKGDAKEADSRAAERHGPGYCRGQPDVQRAGEQQRRRGVSSR